MFRPKMERCILGRVVHEAVPAMIAFMGTPDPVSLRLIGHALSGRCKRLNLSPLHRIWIFNHTATDARPAVTAALTMPVPRCKHIKGRMDPELVVVSVAGEWERDVRALVLGGAPRFGLLIFSRSIAAKPFTPRMDLLTPVLADTTMVVFLDGASVTTQRAVDSLCKTGWMGIYLAGIWILQRRTVALKERDDG